MVVAMAVVVMTRLLRAFLTSALAIIGDIRRLLVCAVLLVSTVAVCGQEVDYDALMERYGLVNVSAMGPGVIVSLKYATTDNFTSQNMYGNFRRAYLVKQAAQSLQAALKQLQAINPEYGFIIYDAARPISVQRRMWRAVRGTVGERYVASPSRGGPHNYGVAIDIGLTYKGKPVDMGTPFDTFTADAHITAEESLVRKGRISRQAMQNRRLLRKVLTDNGFMTFSREWWHFERYRIKYARRHFRLLDF